MTTTIPFLSAALVLALFALGRIAAAETFHFTVTADMREFHTAFGTTLQGINDMVSGPGEFHISPGDIDRDIPDNRAEIDAAFGSSAKWYPNVGNHESSTVGDMTWLRSEYNNGNGVRTPLKNYTNQDGPPGSVETTYSWDYGNAHFVALNQYWDGGTVAGSDVGSDGDVVLQLYNWLAADLTANDKPFVFVVGHEPAFPFYRHLTSSLNKYPDHRDAFWDLMDSYNVNAYLTAHSHYYSKYRPIGDHVWQVDAGNAGNDADPPDGKTFLDVVVGDTEVRYDVYRDNGTGTFSLQDTWTQQAASAPSVGTIVSFQQGTDNYGGTVDTFLQEDLPLANNSLAEELGVDNDDPYQSGLDSQILLRFEDIFGDGPGQIPTGPGVTITSARLELTTTNPGNGGALHRMLQPWSDSDTWDLLHGGVQANGVEAFPIADLVAGENGGVAVNVSSFDVTVSLQAWLADPESNLGWAFLPFEGDGWDFYSAEGAAPPRLIVNYVPEPGTLVMLFGVLLAITGYWKRRRG